MATENQTSETIENNEDEKIVPLYSLLPPIIRRKIKALKKIQFQTMEVNVNFYEDLYKLECRYHKLNIENYKTRADIVSGAREPTDEECKFDEGYDSPDDNDLTIKELRSKLGVTKAIEAGYRGIPEFWLTTLKNVEITSDLIYHHDEPILRYLMDISIEVDEEEMGFKLYFHFNENPYFSNPVLTKEYEMKCELDEDSPWTFDGPEIIKCRGCAIDWKQGMDVTKKTVQKKRKERGRSNTVVKTVQNSSFFNFFDPPEIPEEPPEDYPMEEMESVLDVDYEVGSFLKEKLVPHAVLYYTGEALDEETSSEEPTTDSEEEEEEEGGGGDAINRRPVSSDKSESEDFGSGDNAGEE